MLKKSKGFTLLELLLSIALFGMIASLSVPVFSFMQTRNDIDLAVSQVVQNLRQAQILSQASEADSAWGVKIEKGKITLFKGICFSLRDANFDKITNLPKTIIPSGLTEINFSKFYGTTQNIGTINLQGPNEETETLIVNSKGMLSF